MAEKQLGHFRILEQLGRGGMGEVWRAHDLNLGRDVALKLLPLDLATDPDRIARFRREARVLASLNHPNIAHLHGFEEDKGKNFLVMELVEGKEFTELIRHGRLEVSKAVAIGRQIVAALESAHAKGIVHRDLKPANLMLTPEGHVKVLDFGLARAFDKAGHENSGIANEPTVTAALTQAGTILGTAAYMSPEQARGEDVDQRCDIWSFGVILYELLTRKTLFQARTSSETLANVLKAQLDLDQLLPNTPPSLRRILKRCLQRDLNQRWHSASDLRIALDDCMNEAGTREEQEGKVSSPASPSLFRRSLPWLAAALIALIAILGPWRAKQRPDTEKLLQLGVPLPDDMTLDGGVEQRYMALSKDGSTIAYVGRKEGSTQLYLRRLDEAEARPISDTDGAHNPFFSPDGNWLAFFSSGTLRKVSTKGGVPVDLCAVQVDRGGAWLSNDTIIFSPGAATALMRIPASGGTPSAFTKLDPTHEERTHRWPATLGSDWVMFTVGDMNSPADYDDAHIDAISLSSGKRITLLQHASMARFFPPHTLLYARGGILQQIRLAQNPPQVVGNSVPVLEEVAGERSSGSVHFDIADNGTLAYTRGRSAPDPTKLIWADRDQNFQVLKLPENVYGVPRISPDGKNLMVRTGIVGSQKGAFWLYDLEQKTLRRLTFANSIGGGIWVPDSKGFLCTTVSDSFQLTLYPLDSAQPATIYRSSAPMSPSGMTPDGSEVLFNHLVGTKVEVELIPLQENAEPRTLISSSSSQWSATVSPSGDWLAYSSTESGRNEVYIQPMNGPGKRQVSNRGGKFPLWSPNGKELFYLSNDLLMSVPIRSDATHISVGAPRILLHFEHTQRATEPRTYDVSPDGSHFVYIADPAVSSHHHGLSIVLHWSPERSLVTN